MLEKQFFRTSILFQYLYCFSLYRLSLNYRRFFAKKIEGKVQRQKEKNLQKRKRNLHSKWVPDPKRAISTEGWTGIKTR